MPSFESIVHDWFRRAYGSTPGIAELLAVAVREMATAASIEVGRLELHGLGTLNFRRRGDETVAHWCASDYHSASESDTEVDAHESANSSLTPIAGHEPGPQVRVVPVRYAERVLGTLAARWARDPGRHSDALTFLELFARECAPLVHRQNVGRWALQHFGQPLTLSGYSPALLGLERMLERAAVTRFPVLIRGAFGTEVLIVAAALHCAGAREPGPFVEVYCPSIAGSDLGSALPSQLDQAAGGSLFLSGIESLPLAAQMQLLQSLPSQLGQRVNPRAGPPPRILASTAGDLHHLAREGRFLRQLLTELDVLSLEVPPLSDRIGDVALLAHRILHKHGYAPRTKCSEEFTALLEAYHWPENLCEIERVLMRLAVMTGDAAITRADVEKYTPWLLAPPHGTGSPDMPPTAASALPDPPPAAARMPVIDWIRVISAKEFDKLDCLHDSLRRALIYMGERYHEPISLGQLARHAYVSPSHLSYLFKQSLGTNFKMLLARLRIEKAKALLIHNGRQRITEVAASAGFSDLSHFEKTFRRFVAASPREYRSRFIPTGPP